MDKENVEKGGTSDGSRAVVSKPHIPSGGLLTTVPGPLLELHSKVRGIEYSRMRWNVLSIVYKEKKINSPLVSYVTSQTVNEVAGNTTKMDIHR